MNQVSLQPYEVTEPLSQITAWLRSHMDVSNSTLLDYSGRLSPFADYLSVNGINDNSLLEYKRALSADRSIKISTKNKKLTIARLFLRELYRHGVIPRDITVGVKGFEQNSKHKRNGLNDDDILLIRKWISQNQQTTPKSLRLTCLLLLLTYHGLRQIEVCRLEYGDIDFTSSKLLVQGKGRDDKTPIHLNPEVTEALRAYCTAYSVSSGQLFFSISNSSYGHPLTTRGLRITVTRLFKKLGINKGLHGLRHFYVTKLVEEYPGDLFTVMAFTRHRSLEQLQVYNDAILCAKEYPRHDRIFSQMLIQCQK